MQWYEILLLILLAVGIGAIAWIISWVFKAWGKVICGVVGLVTIFVAISFSVGMFVTVSYHPELSKLVSADGVTLIQDCFGREEGVAVGNYEVTHKDQTWLEPRSDEYGWRAFRTIPEGVIAWEDLPQDKEFNLYLQNYSLLWWRYSCYFLECK